MNPADRIRSSAAKGYHWFARRLQHFHNGNGSDAPNAQSWNAQYESGRWSYLESLPELSRYSILAGYASHLKPGGAMLDVGCGEGVLFKRMLPHGFSRYVGVDVSASAIARLQLLRRENAEFIAADGEHYRPQIRFDTIVFNEVLYFFGDPLASLARYAAALEDDGIFLISTCTGFRGSGALLRRIKLAYRTLDETRVTNGSNRWSWVCTVLDGKA